MRIRIFTLIFTLIMFSCAAFADEPRVYMRTTPSNPAAGQKMTLEVLVKGSPRIYGADIRLGFDAGLLEAIDIDEKTPGTQINHGNFLNPKQCFFLMNHADNRKGKVSYALSLLNPAPEAEGDGLLAAVVFQVKKPGQASFRIEKAEFGTRDGKVIIPNTEPLLAELSEPGKQGMEMSVLIVVIILIGIIVLKLRRKTESG